jgi:NAD(P)H-dependent FMN reductase
MCSGEIDLGLRIGEESTWYDGFVFVTPAYNDRISGVLETRSTTSAEWDDEAVRCVSYDSVRRAAEHLRRVAGSSRLAHPRQRVAVSTITEFERLSVLKPVRLQHSRTTDVARSCDRLERRTRSAAPRQRARPDNQTMTWSMLLGGRVMP